ncbi:hypothetical protein [Bacteroides sp. 224]|uniref:hypothetical protein n=1 Tax=Bacteroides sp. 224 TaxID=2302936 RepID=UPI0013D07344|nr:hypothetical protein [Bacteroides sp. 224]NDV65649.1 hypothetical protein [Bacteroides sp. 224]
MFRKKILLIISILFLSTLQCFAQKTITKTEFEDLVDYANCRYTAKYIESFRDDEIEKENIDKYDKNIKSILDEATIKKSPKFNELEKLLKNNGWSKTFTELTQKVCEKKQKFTSNEMNIKDAIQLLQLDGKLGTQLKNEVERLSQEILEYYKEETQSSENDSQSTDEQGEKSLMEEYKKLKKEVVLLEGIAVGVLVLFIIVLIFMFKKIKGRESIIKIVLGSDRIRNSFAPKKDYSERKGTYNYTLTDKDVNLIVDKVLECLKLNEEEKRSNQPTNASPLKVTYKYLKGKNEKTFSREDNTPEDSFFRISNESNDTADFEFFGNEKEAIARRIFSDDICEIVSGNYQKAQSVEIIKIGKVKRIEGGWTVIEPIKIKLN